MNNAGVYQNVYCTDVNSHLRYPQFPTDNNFISKTIDTLVVSVSKADGSPFLQDETYSIKKMPKSQQISYAPLPTSNKDYASFSYKNTFYLLGGYDERTKKADNTLWYTTDFSTWHQIQTNLPKLHKHKVVVHKGVLYLVGGISENAIISRAAWASLDGVTWNKETNDFTSNNSLYDIENYGFVSLGDALCILSKNTICTSSNAKHWHRSGVTLLGHDMLFYTASVFKNAIYIVSKRNDRYYVHTYLASKQYTDSKPITMPSEHTMKHGVHLIVCGDTKLAVIAGAPFSDFTTDGSSWSVSPFSYPRSNKNTQYFYHNNLMYEINDGKLRSSKNGTDWRTSYIHDYFDISITKLAP